MIALVDIDAKPWDWHANLCSTGYNGATGFYANNWTTWCKENDEIMLKKISGETDIDTKCGL